MSNTTCSVPSDLMSDMQFTTARIGEWFVEALTQNPVVIVETNDGKLLKRRRG